MTENRAPRIAIVGVRRVRSGLGLFLAKQLAAHGATIPAFVGTRPESVVEARELLAKAGIEAKGFTRLEDLLAAEPVDALVIASPMETHLEWLEKALDFGLHVLCEKPLVWGHHGSAARATELVREFHQKKLVLRENCPWPFTLPAFDALHPGARKAGVRDFAMWMSPSQPGLHMLIDTLSHPLSVLQELTDAEDAQVAGLTFAHRRIQEGELELAFRFVAGAKRVNSIVRLRVVPEQPRPAGYAINGLAAERKVRMADYALTFEDGARSVPVPDPMAVLAGRFVAALRSPVPDVQARRERRRISERMRCLSEIVLTFPKEP